MRPRAGGWQRATVRRKRWRAFFIAFVLVVFCLPLVWTVLASLGIHPDESAYPPTWSLPPSLDGYGEVGVAEKDFPGEMLMSGMTSITATALTILASFLASFSLVHSRLREKRSLAQGFLVLASLPVMAYVIPLNGTVKALLLHDTFIGVSLAQAAILCPLAVYVLFGYLNQASPEFEEAARLEGASALQMLARVILPVNAPALMATAVIVFVLNWNSFLAPMVLSTNHVRTIPMAMSDFFVVDRELDWPTAAAALTVSVLPLVVFVVVTHRFLQRFFLGPSRDAE
ncbi:MAG: carbohydrate ABC transporter permease [Spirochaetia bacterium]|jgi:ABC-type glycerol-3-phosphate transport system permease component